MPALETDLEMGDGSRMIGRSFYFANHPDKVVQLVMLCDPGTYPKYREALSHIINSLKIDLKQKEPTKAK
jgi:hypothetical protein